MKRPSKRQKIDNDNTQTMDSATFSQVTGLEEHKVNDMPDCEVYYMESFISKETSKDWYSALLELDSCKSALHVQKPLRLTRRLVDFRVSTKAKGVRARGNPVS